MRRKQRLARRWTAALALLTSTSASAATIDLFGSGSRFTVPVRSFSELRFHGVVRQQYDFSCGSAALATLLSSHYGRPTTEQTVFRAMYEAGDQRRIRMQGFSLLDMKRYVERLGYQANGYKVSLHDIEKTKIPGIALITLQGYRHFVVVKGVSESRVLLGDPARGLRAISREEFQSGWNGVLFAIHSGPRLLPDGFNRPREWALFPEVPVEEAAARASLANFTLSLPRPSDF